MSFQLIVQRIRVGLLPFLYILLTVLLLSPAEQASPVNALPTCLLQFTSVDRRPLRKVISQPRCPALETNVEYCLGPSLASLAHLSLFLIVSKRLLKLWIHRVIILQRPYQVETPAETRFKLFMTCASTTILLAASTLLASHADYCFGAVNR